MRRGFSKSTNERATDKDLVCPNLSVSSEHWTYVERVLRNVRRKLGVPEQETTDQICINKIMWGIFMNFCMWAAVHLDKDQDQNQRVVRDTDVSEIQQLFSITQDQIHSLENEDVFGITNKIGWSLIPRRLCTLVRDNVVKQLKAKMGAFSDSVLCLGGKCPEYPRSSKG